MERNNSDAWLIVHCSAVADPVLLPEDQHQLSNDDSPEVAPWFSTYNRFRLPSAEVYPLEPFPDQEFCENSPWNDHVVIAHHGVEKRAQLAGFASADEYIQHLISTAPKRGAFCAECINRACAASSR